MKKSAMARLQTRNRGTSIFVRANTSTNTTVPFPIKANKKTTQTPHLKVHQSNKSLHGKNGPVKMENENLAPLGGSWILVRRYFQLTREGDT